MSPYPQFLLQLKKIWIGLYRNFTPFTLWAHELKDKETLRLDILAGLTVALVLVPQSMAYAQLANLPPYYGLYASFLPVAIAALFGSSRQLATGPVAVVSLLTASALGPIAATGSEAYFAYAVMLALMVGVIQLALGFLRLGVMVDFLSHPVVFGFTNAAAIIIATSQLGKILGVTADKSDHHYETVWNVILEASQHIHLMSLSIAILALALMLLTRYYLPKWPNVLVAVIVTTLISWYFDFKGSGGMIVGSIPEGLPEFALPDVQFSIIRELSGAAMAIALIGFMEAISIAKVMAGRTRQRLNADQELIGQGLANCTASMFQSYAVSGSFSRSAVNIDASARTGFSSIVTALLVGITLLFLTPLFFHLPQPTLAAVIILAVVNLIKLKPLKQMWLVQKQDAAVGFITFALTLLFAPHLENGIIIGVLLSLGFYVYRTMRPSLSLLARHPDGGLRDSYKNILKTCPKIEILQFGGPLFFANTGYFENKVLERVASQPGLKFIIVDAVSISQIDATGERMLHQLARSLVDSKVEFLFCRVPTNVMDILKRSGFASQNWSDHFFITRKDALQYAWKNLRDNYDTQCSRKSCDTFDLSSCVLHMQRRTANPLLNAVGFGLRGERPKSPDS